MAGWRNPSPCGLGPASRHDPAMGERNLLHDEAAARVQTAHPRLLFPTHHNLEYMNKRGASCQEPAMSAAAPTTPRQQPLHQAAASPSGKRRGNPNLALAPRGACPRA